MASPSVLRAGRPGAQRSSELACRVVATTLSQGVFARWAALLSLPISRATPKVVGMAEPAPLRYRCVYLSGLRSISETDMGHKLYIFAPGSIPEQHPLVYWELRHFFQRLSIRTPLARWLNLIHIPRSKPIFVALGLDRSGLRMSSKAMQTHGGRGCDRDDGGPNLQEWLVSTTFALVYLLDWSANLKNLIDRVAAGNMLIEIFQKAFPNVGKTAFAEWGAPTQEDIALCQEGPFGSMCPPT